MKLAIGVELSHNGKTGPVSATYVTQSSCPSSCRFKGNGCYAESGPAGFTTNRLNRASENESPEALATMEAIEIGKLSGKNPLRVHVVGDCQTDEAAQIVSSAMLDHESKFNRPAWTYTHAWRDVQRSSWQSASVIASCENASDVQLAESLGYSTAIVVDEFESDKAYTTSDGINVIPCPEQTGKAANCASCQLCMGPAVQRRLERHQSIGFAVHGGQAKKAKQAIKA